MYVVGDNGLSKATISPKGDISFKPFYLLSKTSQHGRFFSAIEAPDGTIWTAGEEGVFYLRNDSLIEADLLHKKVQIRDIKIDNENNIWLAVEGEGIFQCQFNGKNKLSIIRRYTLQDGLNSIIYLRLLIDANNNIWAGSSKGITVIVRNGIHKNRILNFNEKDGFLPPGYSYLNLYKDKSGIIWATSPFGTAYFNPEDLLVETTAPKLFITGIQLLKKPAKINDIGSDIKNSQNDILKLRYNNNSIRFEFSAIDYSNQENLIYFYKLDGLDDAWINGGNERTISYQNLKPGNYTFYVKALNNKGKWSEETPEFSFTIKLPFWKQWWFLVACIFAGAGILIVYIQRREKKIRLNEIRNTELEKLKAVSFQYQLEIEQVINFFATSINEQNSIDEMLWDVSKNCISKLGFEDCVIYLKDEKRNVLIQKAAWGAKTSEDDKIINAIEIPIGNGIVGSVAQTGKAEIIEDTSKDRRYIPDDANRLSEIAVPIIDDGKVIGVIDSEHPEKNFYTQRHLQILTTVASLCSEKIDKMKAEQTSREKQLEVLQLNSDLANSQLTALRAQMNPHFIFNALNSIQQFVLEGNADEANRYLSRFSKLQREILNNSDQQFIPLEKEKDILEIYLELEQLRFKENFNYTIKIDDSIDTDEIMIPPMIVQPFVENAIWHGLMPKQGNKEVSIDFHLKNDTYLVCTITDNGIGREAASVIKANKETNNQHKSKGLSLVYDRLRILEKQLNQPFEVRFEDLFSENGSARGTKVTLNLYVGYN